MPFSNYDEVRNRLAAESPLLTDVEIKDALPFVPMMLQGPLQRFQAELTYRNIKAVAQFDKTSTYLAVAMILLTVLSVVTTAANLYFYLYPHR